MTGIFLPDGVFRVNVSFTDSDADRFGRVDPSALLWQMQEVAGAHYEALGIGYDYIRSHGCFWALTRTDVEIASPVPDGTHRPASWQRTAPGCPIQPYSRSRESFRARGG